MLDTQHFKIKTARLAFSSLAIYRKLLEDSVLKELKRLLDFMVIDSFCLNDAVDLYCSFVYKLLEAGETISFKEYVVERIILSENSFSLACEQKEAVLTNADLARAAASELSSLQQIAGLSASVVKDIILQCKGLTGYELNLIAGLPDWDMDTSVLSDKTPDNPHIEIIKNKFLQSRDWSNCIGDLTTFHNRYGAGIFSTYRAFTWEHSNNSGILTGIDNPDPVSLADLIGYEAERAEVLENTLQFVNGFPANNLLLYGDRGTGKSSTVKAILNEYYSKGLRLLEVQKKDLIDFPAIIRKLKGRKYRFIIFVDDLAFEDKEENYTALKSVLEGGIEAKPDNVVIYATSNRRHLVKENFSDRLGLQSSERDDEIRAADSIQEKLSLSDRFGVTVVFSTPDKQKYLQIVEGMAAARKLDVDSDYLHKEALKWELWYNGRSPRSARQFMDWLEGKLKR